MKVAEQTTLPVPREAAWRVLMDWERQPMWMADADQVGVLTSHREGVGVRILARSRVLSFPILTEQLEVTLWEPPRRLVIAHRSFVRGVGEWILEPAAGGTRFRWTEDLSLPVPLLGELALLGYLPVLRRLMRRSLANLQALVRTEAT